VNSLLQQIAVIVTFAVVSKFKQKIYSANPKKHATPYHVIRRKTRFVFSAFYLPTHVNWVRSNYFLLWTAQSVTDLPLKTTQLCYCSYTSTFMNQNSKAISREL